jgi:hypothetical protein
MKPNCCDRGPADLRPELHLGESLDSPAVLLLKLTPFARREIDLAPRYVRLLLVLAEAWQEDTGEVEALRGFRSADEVGVRLARFSSGGVPVRAQGVKALVYELSATVRREARSYGYGFGSGGATAPDLFDRRRKRGYRLGACGLDVRPFPRDRRAARSAGISPLRRADGPAGALAHRIPGAGRPRFHRGGTSRSESE